MVVLGAADARAQSGFARAKKRMAQKLAEGGLYGAPDAIGVMRNRNEKEAARAVLGLLTAHQLDGRRPPKGFGLATPAMVRENAIDALGTMTLRDLVLSKNSSEAIDDESGGPGREAGPRPA